MKIKEKMKNKSGMRDSSKQTENDLKDTKTLSVLLKYIDKYFYIFILIWIFAVYLQVINFSYTGFDDDFLVVNNMQKLLNAKFEEVFAGNSFLTDAVSGFYRPIQTITFIMDAQIGSGALWMFHMTNLFLFCLASLLLFKLFRKFGFDSLICLITTLVFSLHPLFSINVAWLPARGDLLIAVFGISSFLYFLYFLDTKKIIFLLLHILLLLLAFFSKETAIILPALMYLYYVIFMKKFFSAELLKLIILWIFGFSLWFYLRFSFSGSLPENQIFGIIPFIENLRTIPEYISKFILPLNLMSLPVFNNFTTSLGMAILILLVIIIFWSREKGEGKRENKGKTIIIFGIVWFILLVLPGMLYSRYYPKSGMFYHYLDHRAYLPLIGFVILLLKSLEPDLMKVKPNKLFIYGIALTIILSSYSFFHVKTFANPANFLNDAVEDNSKAAVVYFLRGNFWKDSGKMEEAINDYTRAVSIDINYAEAYNNRGSVYGLLGDNHKAIRDLTMAIKLEPNIQDGFFNRAIARDATGDYAGAIEDYNKSIEISPDDYLNYFLRGNSYKSIGQTENAIRDYTTSLNLNKRFPEAYFNRGNAFSSILDSKKAIEDYSMAIRLNPHYVKAFVNRGIERYKTGDKGGACADWGTASESGNESAKQMQEKYCGKQ